MRILTFCPVSAVEVGDPVKILPYIGELGLSLVSHGTNNMYTYIYIYI